MNYRHHFHAGNFADVMKHALLLALIAAARAKGMVSLVETHAGAGLYDLESPPARRTGEAEAGVGRLMQAGDLPASLEALRQAVRRENGGGALRYYAGSPLLALGALEPGDRYVGCELRAEDHQVLDAHLRDRASDGRAKALRTDGYAALDRLVDGGALVLIDPPYERGDDHDRAVEAVRLALARGAGVALWAPIKDLETLDGLVRRIEALAPHALLLAEVRLGRLDNPLAMNGAAMLLIDLPDVESEARAVCGWTASRCGGPDARGAVARLAPL